MKKENKRKIKDILIGTIVFLILISLSWYLTVSVFTSLNRQIAAFINIAIIAIYVFYFAAKLGFNLTHF